MREGMLLVDELDCDDGFGGVDGGCFAYSKGRDTVSAF